MVGRFRFKTHGHQRRVEAFLQLSSGPTPHFDQSNCLEKSIGEPPSISMVELGFAHYKVEADLDA